MGSKPPDEKTVNAWLEGKLTPSQEKEIESYFADNPQDLPKQEITSEMLSEIAGSDYKTAELADLIVTIGRQKMEIIDQPDETWIHILTPSERPDILGMLGRHEVTEVIARGGMGIVLKARDPELDRVTAIKLLSPSLAGNATASERFLREARAAAKLEHENILPIYGVHDDGGIPHFSMRYYSGDTLQTVLDTEKKLTPGTSRTIALQIASALNAAHAAGIVHRDIKPANILLDKDRKKVMVCDFGIARSTEDPSLTYEGCLTGTPQYMSPEQATGKTVDGRSDLFSLGAVLYRCATGELPFKGDTTASVIGNLVNTEPIPPREIEEGIPVWLEQLLARLLAKNPDDRPANGAELLQLLEEESSSKRDSSWSKTLLMTGAAAAVVGILAFLNMHDSEDEQITNIVDNVPRIANKQSGQEFDDIQKAVDAASNGDTIELSGEFYLEEQVIVPRGRTLHLRGIDGSKPTIIAGSQEKHGLLVFSSSTFEGIRFLRRNAHALSMPCLGVTSGAGTVQINDCHFEHIPRSPGEETGYSLGLTDFVKAEVTHCSFRVPRGYAILFGSSETETAPMNLKLSDSLIVAGKALHRRSRSKCSHTISIEKCTILCDEMFTSNYRNPFFPLSLTLTESIIDAEVALLWLPDVSFNVIERNLTWSSRGNFFRRGRPMLKTTRHRAGAGFQERTIEPIEDLCSRFSRCSSESDSIGDVFDRVQLSGEMTSESLQAALSAKVTSPAEKTLQHFVELESQ